MATHSAIELDGVAGWTVELMERWGGLGAGLAIAAENLFPPVPSEVILPMAGFAAGMQLFPEVLATGIAVTLLVGLVAGIVPAIRSARRSIPDGLRQVG